MARPRSNHGTDLARRSRRGLAGAGAIAIVVGVLVYAAANPIRQRIAAARLPTLPDLSAYPSSVQQHLSERSVAARQGPTSTTTVGALCLAFHADLFYEQADRCYALVTTLSPSDWKWTYYRAILQSERGGSDALAASLRQVVASAPDFAPAWLRLGEADFKARRYDGAEEAWRRAAASPEPPPSAEVPAHKADIPVAAYASLGLARLELARGNAEAARRLLERATMQAPRFGSSFRLLAESDALLGRQADAEQAIRRANQLPPFAPYADPMVDALARESRSSTFLLRLASEADLAINAGWSEFLTRRALTFDPTNPEVVSKLGRLLRTLRRSDEALEFLASYTRLVPDDFEGIGQLGTCLSDLRRFDEAEPLIRRALEKLDDALTHYNLAALLSATGRFDEAILEYERSLQRNPSDPDAHSNLGAVLIRQKKLVRASQELDQTLQLDPDNANAHTNLGLLLAQQGQSARAVREFQTALRIDPHQRQASEALRLLGQ